jgi:acyl-CoA thioester hydrolase
VSDAQFRWPVRVYYEDTDTAGIVYYASYLKFMERARTEWLRLRGFNHLALSEEHDTVFIVARLNIHYRQPARLDDQLLVGASVSKVGRASFDMQQLVYRDEKTLLCSATVRLACVSGARMKPVAIPHFLLTELKREN